MKRNRTVKTGRKPKTPPVSKDPLVFETAFQKRLGQTPAEYLMEKIQSGSDISSIEYLFDIVSAEIAMKNHCVCKGFAYYNAKAQERIKAMKKRQKTLKVDVFFVLQNIANTTMKISRY